MTMISLIAHVGLGFLYLIEQRMPFFPLHILLWMKLTSMRGYLYIQIKLFTPLTFRGLGFLCINNENSYF